jgi:hypothetical protein
MKAYLILLFHADLTCFDDGTFKLVLCSTILVHCTFVKLCVSLASNLTCPRCAHTKIFSSKKTLFAHLRSKLPCFPILKKFTHCPLPMSVRKYVKILCCESGIRCLFDHWIRGRNRFFPDPGSQTQTLA